MKRIGESEETRLFKRAGWALLGLLGLFIFAFSVSYFYAIRGREEVVTPDLTGMKLLEALQALQEKSLAAHVRPRFTSEPLERGSVIEQSPMPGSFVKKGRKVILTVSKGSVVDRIGDYVGKTLGEVSIQIQALFAAYEPLLRIAEPVTYVFHEDVPAGTIIAQNPSPGTEIGGPTALELVVSRGVKGRGRGVREIKPYVGKDYTEVMFALSRAGIPFLFDSQRGGEGRAGEIIAQVPASGEGLPEGEVLRLRMIPPSRKEGFVFGFFRTTLPRYPIYVDLKVRKILPDAPRIQQTVVAMKHPGGPLSIPYYSPPGTRLILSIYGKEVKSYRIPEEE